MSKGIFTDKTIVPGDFVVLKMLGTIGVCWEDLCFFLGSDCGLKGEWKFYGKNFGWAFRYQKSGRSVVALYPDKEKFNVQIILNSEQVKQALALGLNLDLIRLIQSTQEIAEGKWVYIIVEDLGLLEDIKKLILIRLR